MSGAASDRKRLWTHANGAEDQDAPVAPGAASNGAVNGTNGYSDLETPPSKTRIRPGGAASDRYARVIAQVASRRADPAIEARSVAVAPARERASGTSEYSAGAVLALRLVDFQVASDATYAFGPLLNLVLGSNGTGKSTVINALFLVFRGPPTSLDRHDYAECIQHGKNRAFVSVQIQAGDPAAENLVLTMALDRARPRVAEWFLWGRSVSTDEVDVIMAHHRIQVNNLCQFLSQFRVAAFSGESAEERLKSTESAIGYAGIAHDHEVLASAGTESSALQQAIEDRDLRLATLATNRDMLQRKLEQIEQALSLRKRVHVVQNAIALKRLDDARRDIEALNTEARAAKRGLDKFNANMNPYKTEIQAAQTAIERIQHELAAGLGTDDAHRDFTAGHRQLQASQRRVHNLTREASQTERLIKSLDAEIQTLGDELSDARLATSEHETVLREAGMDEATYNTKREEVNRSQDEYLRESQQLQKLRDSRESRARQRTFQQNDLRAKQAKLQSMQDRAAREQPKGNAVDSNDPNVNYPARNAAGVRKFWRTDQGLQRNVQIVQRVSFKKPVVLPAILSLNIRDARISKVLTSAIRVDHLHKFVCQTREDQAKLSLLASREELQLRTTLVAEQLNEEAFSDTQIRQLKKLGFAGVLTDFLDGPPAMMGFMNSLGLHTFLVSFEPLKEEAIKYVGRLNEKGARVRCADLQHMYSFSRSYYGQRAITEETRTLDFAAKWTQFMLQGHTAESHQQHQQESARAIAELQTIIENLEARIARLDGEIAKMDPEVVDAQDRCDELRRAGKELAKEVQRQKILRDNLRNSRRNEESIRQRLEEKITDKQQNMESLPSKLAALNESIVGMPAQSAGITKYLPVLQSASYKTRMLKTEIEDHRNKQQLLSDTIARQRRHIEDDVNAKKQAVAELVQATQETRRAALVAEKWLRDNGEEAEAQALRGREIGELHDEIGRLNSSVTLQDEQQTESLASIQTRLASTVETLETETAEQARDRDRFAILHDQTDMMRSRWETAVKTIVANISAKFSELFTQVGTEGYVELATPDALAVGTWGIDIFVAFRPGDPPARLSRMRQSGGERAVTTAVYLLSLQNLAQAPFRVLDEINQGMDEKNERTTMGFFVNLSCNIPADSHDRQQYFLVTPKIISNIPHHRNMNTVMIFGGEIADAKRLLKPTQVSAQRRAMESIAN